ncbi:hypothetical protein N7486_002628 [Penicillium sp. IBT 16267x]|nr:hypothetical protein N7486_002628 [Penicillium sp. IBT 16267x]
MKSFLALTALAALCNSAYCFKEGTYKIGSASLEKTKVLTEVPGQEDLVFNTANGHPGQIWDFSPNTSKDKYFFIQNNLGAYIKCGSVGSLCTAGDEPASSFRPESVEGGKYELVDSESGYFLHLAEDNKLKLAEWDYNSLDQEFVLTRS